MDDIAWLRSQVDKNGVSKTAAELKLPCPTVLSLLAGLARPTSLTKLAERRSKLERAGEA